MAYEGHGYIEHFNNEQSCVMFYKITLLRIIYKQNPPQAVPCEKITEFKSLF